MNWSQLIQSAYRPIGKSNIDQKPELLAQGLELLNMLLATWRGERLMFHFSTVENFTLTASDPTYTIGPTGDFVTVRPTRIISAYLRENNIDFPVFPGMTATEYDAKSTKSVTGYPLALFYNPTAPNGTVNLWPTPSKAFDFYIDSLKPLAADLTNDDIETEITLPSEYLLAIRSNLAILLADDQGVPITPTMAAIADQSKKNVKRLNAQPTPQAVFDLSTQSDNVSRFNIYRG